MRKLWPIVGSVVVGVLVGFLVLWVLGILPPEYGHYCPNQQTFDQNCPIHHVAYVLFSLGVKFLEWSFIAVTAAATGVIAWLTKRLWQINRSQLRQGRKVERAYLHGGGEPIGVRQWIANGVVKDFPTFRLDINNHGKTPGELLEYGIGWCNINEVDSLPPSPKYKWYYYRDFVQSNAPRPVEPLKMPSESDISEIVIFGRFGYRDIFGKPHSNGFIQHGGKPIKAPHISYTKNDPSWDLPNVEKRQYENDDGWRFVYSVSNSTG